MSNTSAIETALRAAERPILLETNQQLANAAMEWSRADMLGIDTEFLRERTYRAELGLVQVSDGTSAWLVDVVKIPNLQPLKELFSNSCILKIFHSASEDFEVLWHTLKESPDPVMDTQIACAVVGQPLQMSYHNAIKWLTAIEVDKDQTRSNWLRRPLRPEQLHYAATDVVFLPMLAQHLIQLIQEQDRMGWLHEEVARLISSSKEPTDPETAYLRIGGIGSLEPAALKVIRELARWREEAASERNLARGFVISDSDLMKIARYQPQSVEALVDIAEIHPRQIQKYGEKIIKAIRHGLNSDSAAESPRPLDNEQKRKISKMQKQVKEQAEKCGIDPALLASRKVLEALLRAIESDSDIPERLAGWRKSRFVDQLIQNNDEP